MDLGSSWLSNWRCNCNSYRRRNNQPPLLPRPRILLLLSSMDPVERSLISGAEMRNELGANMYVIQGERLKKAQILTNVILRFVIWNWKFAQHYLEKTFCRPVVTFSIPISPSSSVHFLSALPLPADHFPPHGPRKQPSLALSFLCMWKMSRFLPFFISVRISVPPFGTSGDSHSTYFVRRVFCGLRSCFWWILHQILLHSIHRGALLISQKYQLGILLSSFEWIELLAPTHVAHSFMKNNRGSWEEFRIQQKRERKWKRGTLFSFSCTSGQSYFWQ